MDYNRVYKALYLYHIEERQSLNYISDETGLSPKQIMQLAKGSLYPTVYLHFMKDRETEDFSREYPYKTRKIKDSNINPLLETCCRRQVDFDTFCSFAFYTSAENNDFRFLIR